MNQTVTEVKDIIKTRRLQLGLSYSELGKMCGVDKTTAWKWELGKIENMKRDKMVLLSKALDISPLVLLGIEEYVPNHPSKSGNDDKIPVYQAIVGNQLEQAIANIDNPYPHEKGEFFALSLEVNDDQMTPLLSTHEVYAIFKKQSVAENGAVVAVAIANEKAMIKKFYKFDDVVVLRPTTEKGEPMTMVGEQVNEVCILGKLVGMVSPFMN
ncbi:MAG: S24 family peptidase [Turicibacter sp.]|nr:LexA repressor [Turicibacter sanguinis]